MKRVHRYRVTPQQSGLLTLRTHPNAACAVGIEGMDEARITAFADPDGFVEIHVRPERESRQIHRLIVSAEDDPLEQVVEILPSAAASEDFLEIPEPQMRRGVPPRQSPEEPAQPENQFGSWLSQQMTGGIRVKPEVKAHPSIRRLKPYTVQPTPTTSLNWSGFAVRPVTQLRWG